MIQSLMPMGGVPGLSRRPLQSMEIHGGPLKQRVCAITGTLRCRHSPSRLFGRESTEEFS